MAQSNVNLILPALKITLYLIDIYDTIFVFRFPHVRLRLGRYEYEDRKLLCIAALDFYQNVIISIII